LALLGGALLGGALLGGALLGGALLGDKVSYSSWTPSSSNMERILE